MGYLTDVLKANEVAQLQGTYAAMWLNSSDANSLYQYHKVLKIPNLEPAKEYHITTTYSHIPMDIPSHDTLKIRLDPRTFQYKIFKNGGKNILVLSVKHPLLNKLWQEAIDLGCTWDHDEYIPHITLSGDVGSDNPIIDNFPPPPPFALQLDRYTIEDLKD